MTCPKAHSNCAESSRNRAASPYPVKLLYLPSRLRVERPPTLDIFLSRVSLPEEPPTAPPQNVIASGRTNQSIMIQWQPPPESHQNGLLKGYVIR